MENYVFTVTNAATHKVVVGAHVILTNYIGGGRHDTDKSGNATFEHVDLIERVVNLGQPNPTFEPPYCTVSLTGFNTLIRDL
jgi:hypothetical protein